MQDKIFMEHACYMRIISSREGSFKGKYIGLFVIYTKFHLQGKTLEYIIKMNV